LDSSNFQALKYWWNYETLSVQYSTNVIPLWVKTKVSERCLIHKAGASILFTPGFPLPQTSSRAYASQILWWKQTQDELWVMSSIFTDNVIVPLSSPVVVHIAVVAHIIIWVRRQTTVNKITMKSSSLSNHSSRCCYYNNMQFRKYFHKLIMILRRASWLCKGVCWNSSPGKSHS
jgi:hypothetical protein